MGGNLRGRVATSTNKGQAPKGDNTVLGFGDFNNYSKEVQMGI